MDMNFQKENRQHINTLITKEINNMDAPAHEMQLSDLIITIVESWRLISGIVLLMLSIGVFYVIVARPVYQVDVLLQVEEKSKGIGAFTELADLLQEESPVTAEFEILRSRMVIGSVVDNLKLDISASAKHLPLIGGVIASGSESIQVENFDIPVAYQGEVFELVADGKGGYKLFGPEGRLLTRGTVGKPVKVSLENEEFVTLFVSELKSKPGVTFELIRVARLTAIKKLKKKVDYY